jgi:hypothetical protein
MKNLSAPTLAEDLLLVLFQPDSGTIAGENTLYYVLAGPCWQTSPAMKA